MNYDSLHTDCAQKSVQIHPRIYTDNCGSHVRSGRRQSIPSNSIDNCARVRETLPSVACGQTKRPRSNRFANRHNPSPSNQRTLIRSPRRPRNTNTCPDNGLCSSFVCTNALNPVNPRRKSVTPAAIQMRVLAGSPIMLADTPATLAPTLDRRYLRSEPSHDGVRGESFPSAASEYRCHYARLRPAWPSSRSHEPAATSPRASAAPVGQPGKVCASQTVGWRLRPAPERPALPTHWEPGSLRPSVASRQCFAAAAVAPPPLMTLCLSK